MDLAKKKCVPCETGGSSMPSKEVRENLAKVPGWQLDGSKIKRELEFKDFVEAMMFVDDVAEIAEEEGHHPDIHIHWNKVLLELWTHSVGGLTENDFILAAKINNVSPMYFHEKKSKPKFVGLKRGGKAGKANKTRKGNNNNQ